MSLAVFLLLYSAAPCAGDCSQDWPLRTAHVEFEIETGQEFAKKLQPPKDREWFEEHLAQFIVTQLNKQCGFFNWITAQVPGQQGQPTLTAYLKEESSRWEENVLLCFRWADEDESKRCVTDPVYTGIDPHGPGEKGALWASKIKEKFGNSLPSELREVSQKIPITTDDRIRFSDDTPPRVVGFPLCHKVLKAEDKSALAVKFSRQGVDIQFSARKVSFGPWSKDGIVRGSGVRLDSEDEQETKNTTFAQIFKLFGQKDPNSVMIFMKNYIPNPYPDAGDGISQRSDQ